MKYIGENAIKKLIALIKSDLAKKQNSITVSGLLKGDGTTISAAVAGTDYVVPSTALNELPGHIANGDIHVTAEEKQAWSDSDVFVATYGTTTGTEIWDAYRAGKIIFANKSERYGLLAGSPTGINNISFYCVYNGEDYNRETYETYAEYPIYELWICQGNSWKIGTIAKDAPLHASTHASGGSDPITPADIGAATMTEVNSAIQSAIQNTWEASY